MLKLFLPLVQYLKFVYLIRNFLIGMVTDKADNVVGKINVITQGMLSHVN